MLNLDAEIQVAGYCEPLDTFTLEVGQGIDHIGRVLIKPIRATLTSDAAVPAFFTAWGVDSHMRRSGQILVYENEQTRWRLTFYDAWCVLYKIIFQPGKGTASYKLTLLLSPAAVDINGIHVERHMDLWWDKNPITRFNALTKPANPLPSPGLRAGLPLSPTQALVPSLILSPITGAPQLPRPPKTALAPKKKPKCAPTIAKWYKKGALLNN